MATELKDSMRMISHQIKNTYKEIKIVLKHQIEILELKSTRTQMKSSLEGLNIRFELAKGKSQET